MDKHLIRYFICGILIGGGSILPGVSGGVLAVVLGLYRPLMAFLTTPKQALQTHWRLLPPLVAGLVVGFVAFAKVIALAMGANGVLTTWAFIGLIAGTLPSLVKEAGKEGRSTGCYVSFALCAVVVFASLYQLGDAQFHDSTPTWWLYAIGGSVLGLGTVVPGLSASSILMAMGLYTSMMTSVGALDFGVLIQYVPWTVVTVLGFARLVTWFFARYYALVFHGILGIVMASTLLIIPTSYTQLSQFLLGLLSAAAGFALAWVMVKLEPTKDA